MSLGIVIPTLNEEEHLAGILEDLARLEVGRDIVVVDGGSEDATAAVAARAGVRVLRAPRGRALQMNAGAAVVTGEWLCFLHADVRMPADARAALRETVARPPADAAVWKLAVEGAGVWMRVVEAGALLRDRLGGLPYGDQGFLVRRTVFEAVGGFPSLPIMEDVALARAVRRRTRLARLPAALVASGRRWRREGAYRTWIRNAVLMTAYLAGTPPERLARWYPPEPR
jgi:rSAM/selenodomain-associated transferase 2